MIMLFQAYSQLNVIFFQRLLRTCHIHIEIQQGQIDFILPMNNFSSLHRALSVLKHLQTQTNIHGRVAVRAALMALRRDRKKTNSWYFIVIYLVICTVEQNGLYWAVIIWARFRRNWCFWCFVLIFIVFEIGGIGEIFVEHVGLCCWNVEAFVRCSHGRSCHFFWDCWHCWKVCSNRCCQLRLIQWGRWL